MIVDSIVAFLLLLTIIYCWRLSRKITALNNSRKELQALIGEFDKAIVRAETGITTLKALSQEADEQLKKHIEKARFLTNDLAFLTHKGDNIADKLEVYISGTNRATSARKESLIEGTPQQPNRQPSGLSRNQNQSSQIASAKEENIKKTLGWKDTYKTPINSPAQKIEQDMSTSKRKALEEVLEQIAARKRKSSSLEDHPAKAEQ